MKKMVIAGAAMLALIATGSKAAAQDMPADYTAVLKTLGKPGDFKGNVLKVNIPRGDLVVAIDGVIAPIPFGFGGWVAMTKGDQGMDVMMGDLVLTEREVNPVMSAVLDAGLEVTALHNHFFFETPRIYYMHVHGVGAAAQLAAKIKPAVDLIGKGIGDLAMGTGPNLAAGLTTDRVAKIIGTPGEQTGPVYKITIGRPDLDVREHGARIDARMGLNTWAAFTGGDADAMVAGDVAMTAAEVTPVLKAMRGAGLQIVAIHHHMLTGQAVYFLHYWGRGPAEKLAGGVRAALDQLAAKAR
jgi:Domain of Unknown Function (DUF1259)